MRGRWDAKYNPRDYAIEEPYRGPSMASGGSSYSCLGPEKAMGSHCTCKMFITVVNMISPCLCV